jgi:inner membrane protein
MLRTHHGTRTDRLAMVCAHRGVSLALAAAIAVTDHVAHQQQLPFLARGLMDEPCHLATAMIVLGALTRWRGRAPSRWFVWAMLSASVLIDLDHLPLEFGSAVLTAGTPRPYTHALWVLVLLTAAAAAARRRHQVSGSARAGMVAGIAAGAALGVAAHFLRDVATAPIALWWPVSSASAQMPGYWYLAALLVLATLPSPRPQP